MDDRASLSKPQIAVLAAFIYTAIMGIGMFYMKTFMGITYGQPEMMNLFWFILIILNIINVFWVTRYFSWQTIGFRSLDRKQLLWFLPLIAVLIACGSFFCRVWRVSPSVLLNGNRLPWLVLPLCSSGLGKKSCIGVLCYMPF